MADGVFNIALGRVAHYCTLPETNDALVIVLLKANDADSTLKDYDDLDALLTAAGNTEADFTNYGARKTITSVTVTVDDTNDRVDIDFPDQTWTSAGGASNNTLTKLLVCYDADTTAGTDADIIPLTHHDFSVTTDGTDLVAQLPSAGFYRAT